MADSVPEKLDSLSAQFGELAAAAAALETAPEVTRPVRDVALALESAAHRLELTEVAAGAQAIQRAADAHLARSVSNFLARVDELRREQPGNTVTLLIVEDDETEALATKAYLERPGRKILIAQDAQAASAMLEEHPIDLVILDLILPDRDGRELLVELREHASTATLPVVVVSSTENPAARAECLAVGADAFMAKPTHPKALRSTVARHLDLGRRRRDADRDGLTGLRNRAGLAAAFAEKKREAGANTVSAVGVVSLDSLADVAAEVGSDAADRFVLETCAAIHESLAPTDVLGRWAQSELVFILPGRPPDQAKDFLETAVRRLMDDPVLDEFRAAGIHIELTGGVSEAFSKADLQEALSGAERSLFSARAADSDAILSEDELDGLASRRILLVEDDRVTATLVNQKLMKDDLEVVAFVDGLEAFEWCQSDGDFDLAILDVMVPGIDGFELLARLRSDVRFARVPIVMLTGMGSEADVIRGLELGANDYMLKPFSPNELLARVRRLLHESRRAKSSRASSERVS